jgi:hypothetical protein
MNTKDNLILSKILAELTVFLLNRGYIRFSTRIDVNSTVEQITIEVENFKPEDCDTMVEKCARPREAEIEAYGWTLLGDSNLEIAGLLIDTAEARQNGSSTIVVLTRKRSR